MTGGRLYPGIFAGWIDEDMELRSLDYPDVPVHHIDIGPLDNRSSATMNLPERRPHLRRPCPLQKNGCDWWQVISWFVGNPDTIEPVNDLYLRMEAEAHLTSVHYTLPKTIIT